MNARILKKLCKRAHPLLLQLQTFTHIRGQEIFVVTGGEEPAWQWWRRKWDRKHLSRFERRSRRPTVWIPVLDGTVGVGCMSGYYDPEWLDAPAIDALRDVVMDHFQSPMPDPDLCPDDFTTWMENGGGYIGPPLSGWGGLFRAAELAINQIRATARDAALKDLA